MMRHAITIINVYVSISLGCVWTFILIILCLLRWVTWLYRSSSLSCSRVWTWHWMMLNVSTIRVVGDTSSHSGKYEEQEFEHTLTFMGGFIVNVLRHRPAWVFIFSSQQVGKAYVGISSECRSRCRISLTSWIACMYTYCTTIHVCILICPHSAFMSMCSGPW